MRRYILFLILALAPLGMRAQTQNLDKKNLVVKEWITDADTGRKFLDHVTTWNSEGRKAEEKEYDTKGLEWTKRYEYDASGRLVKELTYNEHGKLDNIRKFEYNEFGKKKTEVTLDSKGRLKRTKTFEYIVSK